MFAVVPLLFRPGPEAAFWAEPPALARVADLLCALSDLPGVRGVLAAAGAGQPVPDAAGVTVARVPPLPAPHARETLGPLSIPGKDLLEALVGHLPSLQAELMLADPRNLALDAAALRRALRARGRIDAPLLLSVQETMEHPCLLHCHYQMLDVGMADLPVGDSPSPLFLDPEGLPRLSRGDREATHTLALAVEDDAGEASPLLAPFSPDGSAPLARAPLSGGCLVYSLLKASSGGPYDVAAPVTPIEGLWRLDEKNALVRCADQRIILGRQDYPPLHEAAGGVLFVRADRLPEAVALYESGAAAGFPADDETLVIASARDLALARALLADWPRRAPREPAADPMETD